MRKSVGDREEPAGKIRLAGSAKPALTAGTWRLHVQQELSGSEALRQASIRSEEFVFSCEADPFALDAQDVYSVYPPGDSAGKFDTTLASIVLKRRTLPWERTVPECPGAPWLALLLFSENEPVTFRQKARPDAASDRETYTELVIPAGLFRRVCPSSEDLTLAVHARFAGRDDKVTEAEEIEEWMSVVVANRLPCSGLADGGQKNTAYLVSVESIGDLIANRGKIVDERSVCLPLLAQWSFYSRKEEYSFPVLFSGLSAETLRILPGEPVAERMERMLERGYVPLNHRLRDGGRTVSWYHGPLRPYCVEAQGQSFRLFPDSGLIYDPEIGMFDVSISAAFMLGRMLALRDQAFSRALVQFRENRKRMEAAQSQERILHAALCRTLPLMEAQADAFDVDLDASLKLLAAQVLLGKAFQSEWSGSFFRSFREPRQEESLRELTGPLARWSLLYDVPFRYLTPDKGMLPPESIRFFYVDYGWLTSMLDGAMSLGRAYDVDYRCDSEMIDEVLEQVYIDRAGIRPHLQRKTGKELEMLLDRRTAVMRGQLAQMSHASCGKKEDSAAGAFQSTGFLLRSELVRGWRGLEFRAFGEPEGGEPLETLRLEVIGPDILIGIFAGKVARLEIAQPPEGMHMGFEKNPAGGFRKMLRNPADGALYDRACVYAEIVMRDEDARVMDWGATAERIRAALPQIKTMDAAYMALELIQNPATGIVREML